MPAKKKKPKHKIRPLSEIPGLHMAPESPAKTWGLGTAMAVVLLTALVLLAGVQLGERHTLSLQPPSISAQP